MIFEKFYRGRNQTVSNQGTGMGLAIAKAVIRHIEETSPLLTTRPLNMCKRSAKNS